MNAPKYKVGGEEWPKVKAIMKSCSCSRLRAVSALKVGLSLIQRALVTDHVLIKACGDDEAAAIDSLGEALLISSMCFCCLGFFGTSRTVITDWMDRTTKWSYYFPWCGRCCISW